ncbi:hypothetical protein EV643_111222 [Kribbella sp. VKM Ac-2527]|uniref:VOC domain-containing protein n=1 Tax=Kribbella caucasensis TaxID=2512215 RepID=A0A4R6K9G8_9ACTN|nr:VOC family protein [Kribbella sp. VKM Ac-2527]TDO46369.1 hypothetical protein EV643_111222 [Kribbella sp. VKM Ac-2527]
MDEERPRNWLVPELEAVVIDTAGPLRLGRFWERLIGGKLIQTEDGGANLEDGPIRIYFAYVTDHKHGKNRVHLDLRIPREVREQAIERALALGATVAHDVYAGGNWQVLRDPDGNEFCLIWQ